MRDHGFVVFVRSAFRVWRMGICISTGWLITLSSISLSAVGGSCLGLGMAVAAEPYFDLCGFSAAFVECSGICSLTFFPGAFLLCWLPSIHMRPCAARLVLLAHVRLWIPFSCWLLNWACIVVPSTDVDIYKPPPEWLAHYPQSTAARVNGLLSGTFCLLNYVILVGKLAMLRGRILKGPGSIKQPENSWRSTRKSSSSEE